MVLSRIPLSLGRMKHRGHFDFVIRTKEGRFYKRACTAIDGEQLVNWYYKYNKGEPLESYNKITLLKNELLSIKKKLWKIGIRHHVSFYGILTNPATQQQEYRRYEVFSKDKFTQSGFAYIMEWLRAAPPKDPYGVFLLVGDKLKQIKPTTVQAQLI